MSAQRTHEDRILWQLQAAFPSWVPALTLSRISLQYNARLFGLRRKGWQIESRVQIVNGVRHGAYRLARPGSFPNPKPPERTRHTELENKTIKARQEQPALPATGSGLLFRDLPERTHPYPD
jgi:hypothetical protein